MIQILNDASTKMGILEKDVLDEVLCSEDLLLGVFFGLFGFADYEIVNIIWSPFQDKVSGEIDWPFLIYMLGSATLVWSFIFWGFDYFSVDNFFNDFELIFI